MMKTASSATRIPGADKQYVERKVVMNKKILGIAETYNILASLSPATPAIVLDDESAQRPGKLNSCSHMIDDFRVDPSHILVTNPAAEIAEIGRRQGVRVEATMLQPFLDRTVEDGVNLRSPLAVLDFCQSLDTVHSSISQYLANHLLIGRRNLVLITFSNSRAGTKPTMEILSIFHKMCSDCIPPCFKMPTVFQQSFDANGKMFQIIFMLEPIETVSEILFRDLLVHRTVFARHPLALQTLRPDIAERFQCRHWMEGTIVKVQDGQLQVRWKLADSSSYVRKYPLFGEATLFSAPYDGTFSPPDYSSMGGVVKATAFLTSLRIQKKFGTTWYAGTVKEWGVFEGEDHWRIEYDDGDCEHLTYDQILEAVVLDGDGKNKKKAGEVLEKAEGQGEEMVTKRRRS